MLNIIKNLIYLATLIEYLLSVKDDPAGKGMIF